jgi:predicted anti-sigma-YlaC factor YlaD
VVPSGSIELDLGRAPAAAYRDLMPFNSRYLAPVCVVLGLVQVVPALWIVIAPHSFFAHVGPFGAFNSHYLGDAASFQAGIGVVLIAAAYYEPLRAGALAIGLASVSFHAINHWIDVNAANGNSNADVADAILLTILALVTIAPLQAAIRKEATCESSWQAHRARSASS